MVAYLALMVAPIGLAMFYSLTDWNGVSPTFSFVGLGNFSRAVASEEVRSAFGVTLAVAAVGTLSVNGIALLLAVLVADDTRGNRLYRLAVMFPLALSPIVIGQIWRTLLNTNGIVNDVLSDMGVESVNFLGTPQGARLSLIGVSVWASLGLATILYVAALKTIPPELHDAATVDGVGPWQRFRFITFPLLSGAVTINVVLLLIFYMRLYEYVLVITGGGPINSTRTVAVLLVQEAFERNRFGYGSAIAVLLLALVAAMALALLWLLRRREVEA